MTTINVSPEFVRKTIFDALTALGIDCLMAETLILAIENRAPSQRRERIAAKMLPFFVNRALREYAVENAVENAVTEAIKYADALIAELDK